jgi:acyl dehydratase
MAEPPSLLGSAMRLALNGIRKTPRSGRRVRALERGPIAVEATAVGRYLKVTDGRRIGAFSKADAVAPPVFPALWELPIALELFAALGETLPRGGILHTSSERLVVRPIEVGSRVRCRVEIEREVRGGGGLRRTVLCRNYTESGQLCSESRLGLLIREQGAGRDGPSEGGEASAVPRLWEPVAEWRAAANLGRRYAWVSGDFNPIHLWRWTARLLGYRNPILHGFCLEAMVAHALIEHRLRGEPSALRRLRLEFRRPILLPTRVRVLVADPAGGELRVVGDEPDRPFAEGEWGGGGVRDG